MHNIEDEFAWGNSDRSWSVRFEEALWLYRNACWNEAKQALLSLADEAEDHQDKAAALLALADLLHRYEQAELLAIADRVIRLITIAPDKMWNDGPNRLLMRGHMAKAKALFWAEDFDGAIHSLCRALSCMSDSKRDAQAIHELAITLFQHTEFLQSCKESDRQQEEQEQLRELWGCREGHFDPWECLQDSFCPGPCSCGIEKWLRKKWGCPGDHAGPWNCPVERGPDSPCTGSPTRYDFPMWDSIERALNCFGIEYRDSERYGAPARAKCTEPHRSEYEQRYDHYFDDEAGLDQTNVVP